MRSERKTFNITDVFAVLALIALTVTSSLRQEDVRFWDESLYLERGLSISAGNQPGWEWNPLYADMYWVLGRVFADPIDLYFAGRASAAVILVLAVWVSMRIFVRPWIAIAGALVMSALPITYVWPGVSSPSAGFLLIALAIAWRWRTRASLIGATALIWLAAATRPEFVWAALGSTLVLLVTLGVQLSQRRDRVVALFLLTAGLVVTPAVLTVAYGNPIDLGSRSWEAFEQHYEFRFATMGDDPWQIEADIVGRDFPGASSIVGAASTNPLAFVTHMAKNALLLPLSAGGHFVGLGGDSLTQNVIGIATALCWVAALVLALLRAPRDTLALIKTSANRLLDRSSLAPLALTIVVIGVALISTFLIYPRPHYLAFVVACVVVLTGFTLNRLGNPRLIRWLPVSAVMAIGAIGFIANMLTIAGDSAQSQVNAQSLRLMNEQGGPWILLTPERPIDLYLANGSQVLEPQVSAMTFDEFLKRNNINVVFDGILLRKADYAQLDGFGSFIEDPESFGFRPIIPNSPFLVHDNQDSALSPEFSRSGGMG